MVYLRTAHRKYITDCQLCKSRWWPLIWKVSEKQITGTVLAVKYKDQVTSSVTTLALMQSQSQMQFYLQHYCQRAGFGGLIHKCNLVFESISSYQYVLSSSGTGIIPHQLHTKDIYQTRFKQEKCYRPKCDGKGN